MSATTVGREARTGARQRRLWRFSAQGVVSLILSLALLVLIIYPLIATLVRTFFVDGRIDLTPFAHVFADPAFATAARNTFLLFISAGALAMIFGSLFAWINERTDARMGRVATLLPLVTFFVPTVGMSIGWLFLGQQQVGFVNSGIRWLLGVFGVHLATGPLNIASWPGLIFMYMVELIPYVYLIMSAALRNVDPALEEASRMSGASPLRTIFRVSLPAVRPSLASAGLMVLIVTISLLSIPLTIGTTARISTLSVYIVQMTHAIPSRLNDVVAVSVILVAVVTIAVLINGRLAREGRQATIGGKSGGGGRIRLGRWGIGARVLMILYLVVAALLPLLSLIVVALEPFWTSTIDPAKFTLTHFHEFFFDAGNHASDALRNSLVLSIIGATVCMVFAAITVIYARQHRRSFIAGTIRFGTRLPSAISHLVIAVAILIALGGVPFHLNGTTTILILAYLVIYIPQASIAADSARGQVGSELVEASQMSGAGNGRTTTRVLLPLMGSGLVSGWSTLFVLIMGDLNAASILSGPSNLVIGAIILNIWDAGIFAQLAVLGTIICVLSAAVVGTVMLLQSSGVFRRAGRKRAQIVPPQAL